ncbi:MAG: hypothetical protein C0490_00630 [Marivirga sp.]|nr:hypothetical protein [Marivirga sp.]
MNEQQSPDLYTLIGAKALEIEEELKCLNRWQRGPLSADKFENMGAFGCNTMTFEQWLQFILIPRVQQIIHSEGEFPSGSMLGTYAMRVFDGDYEGQRLQTLLSDIDQLINNPGDTNTQDYQQIYEDAVPIESVSIGDKNIPKVLYTLASLLPQFEGKDLESQLQTFDTFLAILDSSVRPALSELLEQAAGKTSNLKSRQRIKEASASILKGGRAAEPYYHNNFPG